MKLFRFYHVAFALGVITAYFTAEELGLVHAWTGYVIAALVLIRVGLGVLRRQGFSFQRLHPRLAAPPHGQGGIRHPFIGHALTLALVTCVAGAACTGIAMDKGGTLLGNSIRAHDEKRDRGGESEADEREFSLLGLIGTARAEDGEREGGDGGEEGPLGEIHETFGNLLLPLVLAHVLYLLLFRFELARFVLFVPRKRV